MTESSTNAQQDHPLYKPVLRALRKVFDPEIPLNIYDLGLVYDLAISDEGTSVEGVCGKSNVAIRMTLTAPGCPVADMLVQQVHDAASSVEGVNKATVELVWDPPWTPHRMSEAALLTLNIDDPSQYRPPSGEKIFNINPKIRR
ncbi:MAG: DUF59 domain-containing protein [Planctomycetes bacterium]|nr:DUF59 domain-containing protein [Planctomycetota bacterium]